MSAQRSVVLLHWFIVAMAATTALATRPVHADGRFCISAATLSFGNRLVGSSASLTATVRNCGDMPWTFTHVSAHPATGAAFGIATGCTTGMTLAPAASCDATVTFAPTMPGQTSGGLWLRNTTVDADPLLTFYARGVDAQAGTSTLAFVPAAVAFGAQPLGVESPPTTIELRNQGPADMVLSAIVLNGPQAYDFAGYEQTCFVGASIPAGQSCSLIMTFQPAAAGTRVASLVIDSPQLAALAILPISGIGTSASSAPPKVSVIEYYHAAFDHYFITPLANEIALCDAAKAPCAGWVRTGHQFNAYASTGAPPASVGVCRFYNDSFAPASSHFYALHGGGCEQTLALFPDWQLESPNLFNMRVPDGNGGCAAGSVPVYRLYNNAMGGAPNHRFTTDLDVRDAMIAQGWVPEGNGIGVTFCSPQ